MTHEVLFVTINKCVVCGEHKVVNRLKSGEDVCDHCILEGLYDNEE